MYLLFTHIYIHAKNKNLWFNIVGGISESNISMHDWLCNCTMMVHSLSTNKQHFIRFWLLDSHASIMIYNFKLCQYFDCIFKIMNIHTYCIVSQQVIDHYNYIHVLSWHFKNFVLYHFIIETLMIIEFIGHAFTCSGKKDICNERTFINFKSPSPM